MHYLCGLEAVEDLVRIEATPLAAGQRPGWTEPPRNTGAGRHEGQAGRGPLPRSAAKIAPDAKRFPDCTTPPDPTKFNAHGITIRRPAAGDKEFLVVNHGGREAIEFFRVGMGGSKPALTWLGCVHMPPDTSINSLDSLPDGGFVATQFYVPSKGGIGAVFAREITGGLLEWHPGGTVTKIPGTELSGANGILLVRGWPRDVRRGLGHARPGALRTQGRQRDRSAVVPVDFAPDNLRWTRDGKLLVAGQKFAARREGPAGLDGWTVALVDPDTLKVTKVREVDGTAPFQGVSSALEVGDEIWVGPFRGDRIAWFPKPR